MREPTETPSVLVADADANRRDFVAANLTADGHQAATAASLADARRRLLAGSSPDVLVIAPLEQPGDAAALLAAVRGAQPVLPVDPALAVLCLGPGGDELAELRALRAGADDWASLPLRYPVLLERVRARLRRHRGPGRVRVGTLELDPAARAVHVGTQPVELTNQEFCLLARLASEPTRVWHKRELLADLWGYPSAARTRTLDSHACRLRGKLAAAGGERLVVTVWGVGYRLLSPVDAPEHNGTAA